MTAPSSSSLPGSATQESFVLPLQPCEEGRGRIHPGVLSAGIISPFSSNAVAQSFSFFLWRRRARLSSLVLYHGLFTWRTSLFSSRMRRNMWVTSVHCWSVCSSTSCLRKQRNVCFTRHYELMIVSFRPHYTTCPGSFPRSL